MAKSNYIGNDFDINEMYSFLYGYVSPPFPALGNIENQLVPTNPLGALSAFGDQFKKSRLGVEMVMPLKLSIPELDWDLEVEPIISIRGSNKIIRRYPSGSEGQGSIKERWSTDDYAITIKGVLLDFTGERYPEDQVKILRKYLEYKGTVKVENPLFRIFGIEQIAIEGYDVPSTTGLAIQEYTISAYSDQLFDALLIEV